MEMMTLPDDPLVQILSFLHYEDLISCSTVCQRLHCLAAENSRLWKRHCKVWWNINSCPDGMTWKEAFIHQYCDFGKYIDIYRQICNAWKKIEEFTQSNCPGIYSSLQPGLSEEDLDKFEQSYGITLPKDVRCVYRFHNGQNCQKKLPFGVFGTVVFSRYYCSEILLLLEEATLLQRTDLPSPCLSVIGCLRSKISVYISPNAPVDTHPAGVMFYAFGPNNQRPVVEPNSPCNVFVKAKSFYDWFTTYANELSEESYPVQGGQILRFQHDPESVAVTEHVRISAATAFMPMLSLIDPPQFVFAYRITLSMDSDVHPRYACQLDTRHWIITDDNGKEERVDGPGVVGEYPVVRPGSTYSYISCTHFETDKGTMHGTYTMRNLQTGEAVDAAVPLFRMARPPCVILPGSDE